MRQVPGYKTWAIGLSTVFMQLVGTNPAGRPVSGCPAEEASRWPKWPSFEPPQLNLMKRDTICQGVLRTSFKYPSS